MDFEAERHNVWYDIHPKQTSSMSRIHDSNCGINLVWTFLYLLLFLSLLSFPLCLCLGRLVCIEFRLSLRPYKYRCFRHKVQVTLVRKRGEIFWLPPSGSCLLSVAVSRAGHYLFRVNSETSCTAPIVLMVVSLDNSRRALGELREPLVECHKFTSSVWISISKVPNSLIFLLSMLVFHPCLYIFVCLDHGVTGEEEALGEEVYLYQKKPESEISLPVFSEWKEVFDLMLHIYSVATCYRLAT